MVCGQCTDHHFSPDIQISNFHRCNLYGKRSAGNRLASMLKMGSSKPWKEAMKAITGQTGESNFKVQNITARWR